MIFTTHCLHLQSNIQTREQIADPEHRTGRLWDVRLLCRKRGDKTLRRWCRSLTRRIKSEKSAQTSAQCLFVWPTCSKGSATWYTKKSFNFRVIAHMIIKADLALQVGTDLVKIDLSEETTNILHAVTMIRILMKTTWWYQSKVIGITIVVGILMILSIFLYVKIKRACNVGKYWEVLLLKLTQSMIDFATKCDPKFKSSKKQARVWWRHLLTNTFQWYRKYLKPRNRGRRVIFRVSQ